MTHDLLSPEDLGLVERPKDPTPPFGLAPSGPQRPPKQRAQKDPAERLAKLRDNFLRAQRALTPVAARRHSALVTLDGWRDRVRTATGRVLLSDEEADRLIEGFLSGALERPQ
jgi:hypothetical protein